MSDERRGHPSASSFFRVERCPGSFQLTQQAREIGQVAFQSSPDASKGTRIHDWLASERKPSDDTKLTPEELNTARSLQERAEEQVRLVFQNQTYTELNERRVWLYPGELTRSNVSAQFDRCLYNDEIVLVQNHKTGHSEPVPAKLNSQCRVETLLVAINLKRIGITPKRFVTQINTMPFGVLQAEFSIQELAKIYNDTVATLREAESPMALVNPSIEACDKCPAILVCNAVKSLSVKLNPINTNPDALSHNLDKIQIMKKQMEEFEKFCERGLLGDPNADPPIPPTLSIRDWEMVPGVERRDWKDMELAQQRLINEGIPEHKFKTLKTHTPAAYEKIYAAHYGQKPEELRETFNTLFADCLEIKRNKGSLKRIKDVPKIKVLL